MEPTIANLFNRQQKLAAREKAAEKRERGDELEEKKIFSLEKEEFKMFAASDKAMTK